MDVLQVRANSHLERNNNNGKGNNDGHFLEFIKNCLTPSSRHNDSSYFFFVKKSIHIWLNVFTGNFMGVIVSFWCALSVKLVWCIIIRYRLYRLGIPRNVFRNITKLRRFRFSYCEISLSFYGKISPTPALCKIPNYFLDSESLAWLSVGHFNYWNTLPYKKTYSV